MADPERLGAETQNIVEEVRVARAMAKRMHSEPVPQAGRPMPHNTATIGFAMFGSLLDKGLAVLLSVVFAGSILVVMYYVFTDVRERQIAALALLGATNATVQQIAVDLEAVERELDFLTKQQQWGRSYGPPTMQPER